MAEEPAEEETLVQKLLFYTTASFILLATFSLFAFLFLVPFVIEPAFTTIFMQFDETPSTCVTVQTTHNRGASNCSWTSCKEGCTKEVYECTQILVNYKLGEGSIPPTPPPLLVREERAIRAEYDYPEGYDAPPLTIGEEDPAEEGHEDGETRIVGGFRAGEGGNGSEWYFTGARLYPNVKGCGYPPMLNCTDWYRDHKSEGANFSCYYSRVDPTLVITELDMWQVHLNLVYAMAIPIPSFVVSVVYLTIAYFYIYDEGGERMTPRRRGGDNDEVGEGTPLPLSTPIPPPTSGALTPASEVFREDLASFGHQLKVAMADDLSRESIFTDTIPVSSSNSMNGNLNKMMTTSIITPPGPIAEV